MFDPVKTKKEGTKYTLVGYANYFSSEDTQDCMKDGVVIIHPEDDPNNLQVLGIGDFNHLFEKWKETDNPKIHPTE